jgi:hypothetical protein
MRRSIIRGGFLFHADLPIDQATWIEQMQNRIAISSRRQGITASTHAIALLNLDTTTVTLRAGPTSHQADAETTVLIRPTT